MSKLMQSEFEEFWSLVPRKEGKKKAAKLFKAARTDTELSKILDGITNYAEHCQRTGKEIKFTKHPTTWLSNGCWDDEFAEDPQGPPVPLHGNPGTDLSELREARERAQAEAFDPDPELDAKMAELAAKFGGKS